MTPAGSLVAFVTALGAVAGLAVGLRVGGGLAVALGVTVGAAAGLGGGVAVASQLAVAPPPPVDPTPRADAKSPPPFDINARFHPSLMACAPCQRRREARA